MKQLSYDEYMALHKEDRTILRRAAFGAAVAKELTKGFDLEHLHDMLVARNDSTGWFADEWTGQPEEDEAGERLT